MISENNDASVLNGEWLYRRGWTYSSAARHIHVSVQHLHQVLNGKRESASLTAKLRALPQREFTLRERRRPATVA